MALGLIGSATSVERQLIVDGIVLLLLLMMMFVNVRMHKPLACYVRNRVMLILRYITSL